MSVPSDAVAAIHKNFCACAKSLGNDTRTALC